MSIIVVTANKGGVAKTTTATTLAARLAQLEPTWLLDFDSQGHCALAFGIPPGRGIYEWLGLSWSLPRCITGGRPANLRILSSDPRTLNIEAAFNRERATLLTNMLLEIEAPYVVIDTASRGPLQQVALSVADQVVIPFRLEQFGMDGAYSSLEMVRQFNPQAKITLLPIGLDVRLGEHRDNLARIQIDFQSGYGLVERAAVKNRVAVMRAQAEGKTIWEYSSLDLGDVRSSYELLAGRVVRLASNSGQEREAVGVG
jgi:chromosome partitioning protein